MDGENHYLKCIGCDCEYEPDEVLYLCPTCGDLLAVEYREFPKPSNLKEAWRRRDRTVWRYRELLPIRKDTPIITLGEGGTTLNRCPRLGRLVGLDRLYVKNEGENPTGSFKDRGMTVGVTRAIELGMERVACASTGNTSASLAAYSSRAGLECLVLIPSGKIAFGKLVQAVIHGARVIQVRGNFDEALRVVRELCNRHPIYLLNSVNPYRLEGQKTIAYEVVEQLGGLVPDRVIVPVGNAGNISAIWKGFRELYEIGLTGELPQMVGIQAEGASPIASSLKRGMETVKFVDEPETVATAIRIGSPVNWKKAVRAVKESRGLMETVSDDEILEAQRLLAQLEGLFVEPASAASVAGLRKLTASGVIDGDELVVCIATGHGLKDPNIVLERFPTPVEVDPDVDSVERILGIKTVRAAR